MASKGKSRSGGKSPTSSSQTSNQNQPRKGAKSKEIKPSTEDEKETLAFKVLSVDNTKKLAEIDDVDELQASVAEILQISTHGIDLKDGALVDYYVAGFWWGKEQGYSQEQLSAFYTVIHMLLENIKEKQMPLTENLKKFRSMFAGIGQDGTATDVKLPSGGLETLFDTNQAKALSDYIYTSLFQHYRLFEFTLGHTQAEEIIGTDLEVEVPPAATLPWPPPLDEGVSEETFQQHIATPPSSAVVEESNLEEQDDAENLTNENDEAENVEVAPHEADILAQLSQDEVQAIMDSVFEEMLGGIKTEVAAKLREKENAFINRINKIHNIADK